MKGSSTLIFLFGAIYSFFSTFPVEVLFTTAVLSIFITLAERQRIPFSIQFYFGLFFIQIFTVLLFIDSTEESIMSSRFNLSLIKEIEVISMTQVLVMFLFFLFNFKNKVKIEKTQLMSDISKIKFKNLLIFYLTMSFLFPVISLITRNNASLQQFFMALAVLKDFALILFAFHYSFFNHNRILIIGIFVFEFLLGFISYFSSFKSVIIYVIIVSFTLANGISLKRLFIISPLFVFVLYIMSFWSYVKGDYRAFISNGEVGQNVNVENDVAANYIFNQIGSFGLKEFKVGFNTFLSRVQYLEEYQTVRQNVPRIIPHQYGRLTEDALIFITTPRFLNPNKKILDPSAKTAEFTNRHVANSEMGTSISLGFFTDFYIDFGYLGMFVPLVLIALILGYLSKKVYTNKKYSQIFNISIFIAIITNIGTFESDITFYLGILRNHIVVYFVCDLFVFKSLNRFLTGEIDNSSRREKSKSLHLDLISQNS